VHIGIANQRAKRPQQGCTGMRLGRDMACRHQPLHHHRPRRMGGTDKLGIQCAQREYPTRPSGPMRSKRGTSRKRWLPKSHKLVVTPSTASARCSASSRSRQRWLTGLYRQR
jgi:hypothetical protein